MDIIDLLWILSIYFDWCRRRSDDIGDLIDGIIVTVCKRSFSDIRGFGVNAILSVILLQVLRVVA